MEGKLLHEEITGLVIGAGMDVFNSVGPGWNEWDYHQAMLKALSDRGLRAESHLRGSLLHRGQCVDQFELDILVEGKVILELKHIRGEFTPEHDVQLISYLKFWKNDLGLLMNFGGDRLRFKRVPYTPRNSALVKTGKWNDLLRTCHGPAEVIDSACCYILQEHGLGYSRNTCEKLLMCELVHSGATVQPPEVELRFDDLELGVQTSDCLSIDTRLIAKVTALPENTSSVDLTRLQSCMKHVDLSCGLLVNFGRSTVLLRAVIKK
jgi:GxxExxY protein